MAEFRSIRCHPSIVNYTFPFTNTEISWVEAEAICKAYDCYWQQNKALDEEANQILDQLALRLDEQIRDRDRKVFLKISGQSPKDVALHRGNKYMQKAFAQKLRLINPDKHNDQLIAFLEAVNCALCITSGEQAIEYITKR